MGKEVNIAEILKSKPKGTKLYSPLIGDVELHHVGITIKVVSTSTNRPYEFLKDGRFYRDCGEPLLFPSNEMRDWSKFAWKKGDVLVSGDDSCECIFDSWTDNDYTTANVRHILTKDTVLGNRYWRAGKRRTDYLENKSIGKSAKKYIKEIEKRIGGKLNRETLEVEKPTHTFKVFEKVLVRDNDTSDWLPKFFGRLNVFENKKEYPYMMTEGYAYAQCIPYEGNEHLAFTNKSV